MKKLILLLSIVIAISHANGQGMREIFIDTTDNAIDASKWLSTVTGFVPLIMPITEPAVGYGIGGGLIFFHPNDYRRAAQDGLLKDPSSAGISPTPPSLTGVGGMYTENGSWAAGGGHMAVLFEDLVRYKVAGGFGSINLDYYGKIFPEKSRGFNVTLWGVTNEATMRIKNSNFWGGLGYSFAMMDIKFDKLFDWPGSGLNEISSRSAVLFPSIAFDNRDNVFTPNQGFKAYLKYGVNDTWLGGTESFQSLMIYTYAYHSWSAGQVTGLRLETQNTFGDPTFIYLPFLSMRGLPAMKYQDKFTALMELEQRIKIYNRWSLIAFGGLGKTLPEFSKWTTEELVYSYGTGFRYYLAKKFGLHMGMDFAWGPEDFAFYITFGSGWMRL